MDKLSLIVTLLFMGSVPTMSAEAKISRPAAVENPAYIRFVNNLKYCGTEPAGANGKIYEQLDHREISSYFTVPEGVVNAGIGRLKHDFQVEKGRYYTVVLHENGTLSVRQDPRNDNRANAQIIFYNLSDRNDLSLKTSDGNIEIIPPVAAGEMAEKHIRPLRVRLAIYDGKRKIKDFGSLSFERAQSYSAFIVADNDAELVKTTTRTMR